MTWLGLICFHRDLFGTGCLNVMKIARLHKLLQHFIKGISIEKCYMLSPYIVTEESLSSLYICAFTRECLPNEADRKFCHDKTGQIDNK